MDINILIEVDKCVVRLWSSVDRRWRADKQQTAAQVHTEQHKMVNNDKTAAEVAQQGGLRKSSVDKVREILGSEQREKC